MLRNQRGVGNLQLPNLQCMTAGAQSTRIASIEDSWTSERGEPIDRSTKRAVARCDVTSRLTPKVFGGESVILSMGL